MEVPMKTRSKHFIGVFVLYLLMAMGMSSCSSTQQEAQELENTEQSDQNAEGNMDENMDNGLANEENFEAENMNEENMNEEYMNDENLNNGEDTATETENDLQNIISEMNESESNQPAAENVPSMENDANMVANNPNPASESLMQEQMATTSEGGVIAGAAGNPAAQGLPEIGSKVPYIVQSGDTLGKISNRIYGTPARWRELANLTGLENPNHIYPGDVVYFQLTAEAVPFATAYVNATRQETKVQPGDTLASISKRAYGSSKYWKSIWRQNDQINNPDQLEVGQVVYYLTDAALSAAQQDVANQINNLVQNDTNSSTQQAMTAKTLAINLQVLSNTNS